MDDDKEQEEKSQFPKGSQDNLIEFLEKLLVQVKLGTFAGMVGVLFDDECKDYYFTSGFTPRTAIIGGLTLLLDDIKERIIDSEDEEDDNEEDVSTIPEPENKILN